MAVRPVMLYGDSVLRKRSEDIQEMTPDIQALLDDMVDTMYAEPGVGLAAPQVGVSVRAMVIDLSVGKDPTRLYKLLNPVIVHREGEQTSEEGCLSFPGIFFEVTRPMRVRLEAKSEHWEDITLEAEEILARAVCHEMDHLNGHLFIDELGPMERARIKRRIKKLKRSGEWNSENSDNPTDAF